MRNNVLVRYSDSGAGALRYAGLGGPVLAVLVLERLGRGPDQHGRRAAHDDERHDPAAAGP